MHKKELKNIIQAIIFASTKLVTLEELYQTFKDQKTVKQEDIKKIINILFNQNDLICKLKQTAGIYGI